MAIIAPGCDTDLLMNRWLRSPFSVNTSAFCRYSVSGVSIHLNREIENEMQIQRKFEMFVVVDRMIRASRRDGIGITMYQLELDDPMEAVL